VDLLTFDKKKYDKFGVQRAKRNIIFFTLIDWCIG
jgi:hypothetical protein